jgi:GNAT superfamily N-acetyltransferase
MPSHTPFVDRALAQRLEHTEAQGSVGFVEARMALQPDHGAAWINQRGSYAMFDGAGSPVTQTFGLGLENPLTSDDLDAIEEFFIRRGADVFHEVSPLAGVEVFSTLSSRGYAPVELTSVMFQPLDSTADSLFQESELHSISLQETGGDGPQLQVRQISTDEADMFGQVSAQGWSEIPELQSFLAGFGRVMATRADGPCFVAELDGIPVATGVLVLSKGIALLAGAATIPEYRRRGAQLALLEARLRVAVSKGCDIAMMCAAPGSASQRNAERHGFRIAYTRVKWQLKRDRKS